MPRTLRVLVVTHTARLGGAELALLRLCSALRADRSYSLRVISFSDGDLVDRLRDLDISVDVLEPGGQWSTSGRASVNNGLGLVRMVLGAGAHAVRVGLRVRKLQPDVIQSWTLKTHLVTTLALPVYQRPLVWYLHDRITHDYLGRLNTAVVKTLAKLPYAVLANSAATAATLNRPCRVAYPGLAPEQFVSPAAVRRRSHASPPLLLLLGRISPTKGQRESIVALSRVRDQVPGTRLRIVGRPLFGEEVYATRCHELAEQLGLASAVEFVGHSDDPRMELDSASVLVHASPTPEPFGQVIAEAMARGVPVVATEAGGVPELLYSDGEPCGILARPGDPAALADAIVNVLTDPRQATRRARHAYEKARNEFTIEQTAAIVGETWLRAARSNRSGPSETRCSGLPRCEWGSFALCVARS